MAVVPVTTTSKRTDEVVEKIPPEGEKKNDIGTNGAAEPLEMERFGPAFFILWVNVACPILVFRSGWHPSYLPYAYVVWWVQMTGALAIYHRYFAHHGYKAGRVWQFCMGLIGVSSGQGGPLSWADHHRWHHKHCETALDVHSPQVHDGGMWGKVGAFCWAQGGYLLLAGVPDMKNYARVKDWAKYPELRFLNEFAAVLFFGAGILLRLATSGPFCAYTFCLPTFFSMNCVQLVNSAVHLFGHFKYYDKRAPACRAMNIWWLTPVALGANWHSNHHAFSNSAQAGFEWYEVDPMFWIIRFWAMLGLVWDLKKPDLELLKEQLVENKKES